MTLTASRGDTKLDLPFDTIAERVKGLTLPDVDVVYGIATGGVVPASLVAFRLGVPLELIAINYRREDNSPQRPTPELLAPSRPPARGARVLLVDDVLATGGTLAASQRLIERAGWVLAGTTVVLELDGLGGRERLAPHDVTTLTRM